MWFFILFRILKIIKFYFDLSIVLIPVNFEMNYDYIEENSFDNKNILEMKTFG